MELDRATARQLLAALDAGAVSSTDLLEAHVERMQRWEHCNIVVATDLDRARERAAAADAARGRGESWGALHGLPMTVKDCYETEGVVTTAGAPDYAGHVPAVDAEPVARLKDAGAIVWGHTNTPLLAGDFQTYNDVYGLTRNPWNPDRGAGGSSGGSAAAVATGISALELGSDIGGSIRNPAHYNGVAGHKPTWPAVDGRGHIPGPPGQRSIADLGVFGPLARTADDLDLAMDVLTARSVGGVPGAALPPAAVDSLSGCRVGLWLDDPAVRTEGEIVAMLGALADRLSDAGAELVPGARTRTPLAESHLLYLQLLGGPMGAGMPPAVLDLMQAVVDGAGERSDDPLVAYARGMVSSHRDWLRADERRHKLAVEWAELFERVDIVLCPPAPLAAFPHDTETPFQERLLDIDGELIPYLDHVVWAGIATAPLLPATVVPAGLTEAGLPVGAQLIGPRWGDRTTIAVGRLIDEVTGGFPTLPQP